MKYIIIIIAQFLLVDIAIGQTDSTITPLPVRDFDWSKPPKIGCIIRPKIILPKPITVMAVTRLYQVHQIGNRKTYYDKEIPSLATRNINEIAATAAGVTQTNIGLSFKGNREDGTAYYLDGMRMIPELNLPHIVTPLF